MSPVSSTASIVSQLPIKSFKTPLSFFHTEASSEDKADPLQSFRAKFAYPAKTIYLCGNSLGLQPHAARKAIENELERWALQGVNAHFSPPTPWADAEQIAAEAMAPIVGAKTEEVVVMNSLTVNLHLMLTAFYRPEGKRVKILIEDGAFSSDEYALQTHIQTRGLSPNDVIERIVVRKGENFLRDDDLLAAIRRGATEGSLALVLLPGVQYYTGQVFAMEEACRVARECGVVIGFDLAHAVGNVEIRLHEWGADFAVWCSYKYLNAGPGSLSGCFIHERHAEAQLNRLGGWWGHDRGSRFGMPRDFVAQKGAAGFQISNPPIMALVGVTAATRVVEEAGGVEALRRKSVRLTGFLERMLKERISEEVEIVTPLEIGRRGAQLSLKLARVREWKGGNMHKFNDRLEGKGVVCDVREPDVLRVAPAPLYNSFEDVLKFVQVVEEELVMLAKENS